MRISIETKIISSGVVLTEEYDIFGSNIADANDYAHNLISNFNATLRPWETAREVVSVRIIDKEVV